jgi:hypothetical protein
MSSTERQPMLSGPPRPSAVAVRLGELREHAAAMSMTMDLIFFAAGVCVFLSAVLSVLALAMHHFAPFELVDAVYLAVFGFGMMVMDVPVRVKGVLDVQVGILVPPPHPPLRPSWRSTSSS